MNDFMDEYNNKKSFIGKIKDSFSGRKFRSGAYVTFMSIIVVVIILVANMIVTKLDLKIDMSNNGLYTLTDNTKQLLKNNTDDITIYFLAQAGNEQAMYQKIAQKYASYSNHIKLEEKDPVLYPNFATQYVDKDTKVSENSFIVVNNSNKKSKYIDSNDMLIQEFNQQTYQMDTTGIDVEGKLSSAIQYVTTKVLPIMYVVEGHGETATGDVFKADMDRQNIEIKTLSTLTESTIPKDCNILFINTPTSDFSEAEVTMIKDYMATGGNVLITANYQSQELKNFTSLLTYYGIEMTKGIVVEGDTSRHITNYPHYLVPEILDHDITKSAAGNKVFYISPASSGLKILDNTRSSLKVEPLLATSDKAYSKVNVKATTMSKENGDIDGPFYVGLASTDTYNGITSKMVVYSSQGAFDDSLIKTYSNGDILVGTIGYLSGDSATLTIKSRSLAEDMVYLTQAQGFFWGGLAVIVIPALILITGGVVTYRRRRK